MPVSPALPASVASSLSLVSAALDDIAEANRQLVEREKRVQALVADLVRIGQLAGQSSSMQLRQLQTSMQRESQVFAALSGTLKLRQETAKNSIGNMI